MFFQLIRDRTYAMLKPEVVEQMGRVLAFVEERGFRFNRLMLTRLSPESASHFYAEHAGRSFYECVPATHPPHQRPGTWRHRCFFLSAGGWSSTFRRDRCWRWSCGRRRPWRRGGRRWDRPIRKRRVSRAPTRCAPVSVPTRRTMPRTAPIPFKPPSGYVSLSLSLCVSIDDL